MTNKRIFLVRHAEPVDNMDLNDILRPLTREGRQQASQLAKEMIDRNFICDYALVSPSKRTQETFDYMGFDVPKDTQNALYNGMPGDYLDVIQHLDDVYNNVLLVGHNPTCAMLSMQLTGRGEPADIISIRSGFAQSQLAVFEFDIDTWRDIMPSSGVLAAVVLPKVAA